MQFFIQFLFYIKVYFFTQKLIAIILYKNIKFRAFKNLTFSNIYVKLIYFNYI